MVQYLKICVRLRRDCRGVTAVEYGVLAALIGLVISAALLSLGHSMSDIFLKLGTTISST